LLLFWCFRLVELVNLGILIFVITQINSFRMQKLEVKKLIYIISKLINFQYQRFSRLLPNAFLIFSKFQAEPYLSFIHTVIVPTPLFDQA